MTKQILAFLFCFIRELTLYSYPSAGERVSGVRRAGERASGRAGGYRCRLHHAFDGGIFRVLRLKPKVL